MQTFQCPRCFIVECKADGRSPDVVVFRSTISLLTITRIRGLHKVGCAILMLLF